jgi:hypothetical protein
MLRKRDANHYMGAMSDAITRGAQGVEQMTTNSFGGSAKILQFPARIRPPGGHGEAVRPGENLTSPFARMACGSAWYHEEAIQTARTDERASKN